MHFGDFFLGVSWVCGTIETGSGLVSDLGSSLGERVFSTGFCPRFPGFPVPLVPLPLPLPVPFPVPLPEPLPVPVPDPVPPAFPDPVGALGFSLPPLGSLLLSFPSVLPFSSPVFEEALGSFEETLGSVFGDLGFWGTESW